MKVKTRTENKQIVESWESCCNKMRDYVGKHIYPDRVCLYQTDIYYCPFCGTKITFNGR